MPIHDISKEVANASYVLSKQSDDHACLKAMLAQEALNQLSLDSQI